MVAALFSSIVTRRTPAWVARLALDSGVLRFSPKGAAGLLRRGIGSRTNALQSAVGRFRLIPGCSRYEAERIAVESRKRIFRSRMAIDSGLRSLREAQERIRSTAAILNASTRKEAAPFSWWPKTAAVRLTAEPTGDPGRYRVADGNAGVLRSHVAAYRAGRIPYPVPSQPIPAQLTDPRSSTPCDR